MGPWGDNEYEYINFDNMQWAIDVATGLLDKWGMHPALYAFEPVNEPWWSSDLAVLKGFYRQVRDLVREKTNPGTKFVFHDSFHFDHNVWNEMFADDDHEDVVMDTHQYWAWYGAQDSVGGYCDSYGNLFQEAAKVKYDVWVGEWSLATDVCALWLGGFNDNNTAYSRECAKVECPKTYLPESVATDFDRTADILGPFGSNQLSTIQNGMCLIDSDWYSDADVKTLGQCSLYVFDEYVQGHFLWTMRNELEDRWSFVNSYDKGWLDFSPFEPAQI